MNLGLDFGMLLDQIEGFALRLDNGKIHRVSMEWKWAKMFDRCLFGGCWWEFTSSIQKVQGWGLIHNAKVAWFPYFARLRAGASQKVHKKLWIDWQWVSDHFFFFFGRCLRPLLSTKKGQKIKNKNRHWATSPLRIEVGLIMRSIL